MIANWLPAEREEHAYHPSRNSLVNLASLSLGARAIRGFGLVAASMLFAYCNYAVPIPFLVCLTLLVSKPVSKSMRCYRVANNYILHILHIV